MYNEILMRWNSYPECLDPNSKPPSIWMWVLTFIPINVPIIILWIVFILSRGVLVYLYKRIVLKRKKIIF